MTPAETAKVLAAAAAFDQRTVGTADVAAWHSVLHDLEYDDARDAVVGHFRQSTDRLMPMHIVQHATAMKAARTRFENDQVAVHDYLGDDTVCGACNLPRANRRHRTDS